MESRGTGCFLRRTGVSSLPPPPPLLKGTEAASAGHRGSVTTTAGGQEGEETGGNGSLNSALKQEATPVLSLLCFYRLNFLPARPPLVTTVTIPGAYRGCRGEMVQIALSLGKLR